MEKEIVGSIITMLLQAVLAIAVPIVTLYLTSLIKEMFNKAKANIKESEYALIKNVVRDLVMSAKSSGLAGKIEDIGEAKFEYVLTRTEQELAKYNIYFDKEQIEDIIEAAYLEMSNSLWPIVNEELDK